MGKKSKKPQGALGDFSDEEPAVEEEKEVAVTKKGSIPEKDTPAKKKDTKQKQSQKGKDVEDESEEEIERTSIKKKTKEDDSKSTKEKTKPKKGKSVEEEEEDEEDSKPTKNNGTTLAKKPKKKKKGGNWQEYESGEEGDGATAEVDEESKGKKQTNKDTKTKQTKKSKDKVEDEDDKEEEEEPKKAKGKGNKKTAKQDSDEEDNEPKKVKGKNSKKNTKQDSDEEDELKKTKGKKTTKQDSEEDDDQPKKAKGKITKKTTEQESDEEGDAPKKDKGKKKTTEQAEEVKPTQVAAKKAGKKKPKDDYWDNEYEKDAEAATITTPTPDPEEEEDKKKKTTKKKGKSNDKNEPAEVETKSSKAKETKKKESTKEPTEAAGSKDTKNTKQKGKQSKMPSSMVRLLQQQKEERERLEREAEEIRKKEAEEERIREEEERIIEEEERKRKEERNRLKKEQKKLLALTAPPKINERDVAFLKSLGLAKDVDPSVPAGSAAPGDKKKTRVYQPNRKNKQPKKSDPAEQASVAPQVATDAAPPPPSTETAPAAPEPVAADDWEDWEERVDDVAKKITEVKIEEPKASQPSAASAPPTTAPAPQKQKVEEDGKQKTEENAKPKANAKKDKKGAKKGVKQEDAQEEEAPPAELDEERELRSPICCILGHVDTGKTSLLDKIRQTDVQGAEAGGITQQIGATYFPMSAIQEKTQSLREKHNLQMKVPGLLVIDTPGHESFTNLRSRGSGLCDIAILVVDIMHLLEPQTIESINLLRMRKTPFVVALNKVDRIYGWRSKPFNPFRDSLKIQEKSAVMEFETRTRETINAFAEQKLNAVLYYNNKDFRQYVSLVPTSAFTGEGIPDLLMLLVQLTQKMMPERLYFSNEVQCTVLEVKVIEGLGTTLDIILVNGVLREGETVVLGGLNGPIVTTIRAILVPQPMRELRVKGTYDHLKEIKAAMGAKLVAQDLEKAIAGSALLVAKTPEDVEDLKAEVQSDINSIMNSVDSSTRGVCVQASTLGSLEALLAFLKQSKIPVSGVSIGPVHKRDVIRASVALEHIPEYAVILAFDVKVEREAQELADKQGVQIFTADIIYHLFDRFTAYLNALKQKRREEAGDKVVWPCLLKIKPDCIFNKKAPIVVGMEVVSGTLRLGTPLCVPNKGFVDIGIVTGIEKNHKQQQEAKKGDEVAVKIESSPENAKEFGKHFDAQYDVCSKISRESIDLLVKLWGEELSQPDRQLIVKLKGVFKI